jgi:hypothetical protein
MSDTQTVPITVTCPLCDEEVTVEAARVGDERLFKLMEIDGYSYTGEAKCSKGHVVMLALTITARTQEELKTDFLKQALKEAIRDRL